VDADSRYVFGYGSLLWRPDFHHADRVVGCLHGMSRRYWQGSPDHRGRPDALGRVVTLIEDPGAECWGAAYRVDAVLWPEVAAQLDARESGGFERLEVEVWLAGAVPRSVRAEVYVARSGNPNFLGPAPLAAIAEQVRRARGRSGSNLDYALRLARAVRELGQHDEHVFALSDCLAEPEPIER
jgi:cation transport regulator ChaC